MHKYANSIPLIFFQIINLLQLYLSSIQQIFVIFNMSESDPYQSIENIIKLPKMINASQKGELFDPLKQSQVKDKVSQSLIIKTNDLVNQLNQSFEIFENPQNFKFTFPQTVFPDVPDGQSNQISYEQKMIVEQEDTFKNKLSEEQLKDIEEKGQFKVRSNIEYITLPYVWKINQNLFWGRERREIVWLKSLAQIFGFYYQARNTLQTTIPDLLSNIKRIPYKMFKLVFGAKSLITLVAVDYNKQIFKDFWKKVIQQHYVISQQWSSALWNYLYVYYDPELRIPGKTRQQIQEKKKLSKAQDQKVRQVDQKVSLLTSIDGQFTAQWGKMKKKVFLDLSNQASAQNSNKSVSGMRSSRSQSQENLLLQRNQDSKDDEILQKLNQEKFTLYIAHIQKKLPENNIPIDVVKAIVFLLRLFRIFNKREQKKDKQLKKQRAKIELKIKDRQRIKSLYYPYFYKEVEAEYQKISKVINDQMYQSYKKDTQLNNLLNKGQIKAYEQYCLLRNNYQKVLQAKKKQIKQYHGPQRIFYSNYMLLPPYQVIKHESKSPYYDNVIDVHYKLKTKSDFLTVSTQTNFWKLKLYAMRVKTWTYNSIVILVGLAWKGPFGLRCLYGKQDFVYDMYLKNYREPETAYLYRKTVLGTFNKVLEGIQQSRRAFEQTPDLGLLGKNISRYLNYLECYVFRFFIVGIVVVLVLYPIAIVVFSCLSAALVITFWAWMPLVLLLTYLFNIFIYQFQTSRQYQRRIFPIFFVQFTIIRSLVIFLLISLNFAILMPFKSLFIYIFCFLQRGFRTLLDSIMLLVFTKVGRTPSRDTAIAKKISGPGMSKQFYMSINEQDVYVLVRAQLQKILLYKFNDLVNEKISANGQKPYETINTILKCFSDSLYYSRNALISQNSGVLQNNYYNQYIRHSSRYPRMPYNVRFTQQEIDNYFQNTQSIVKNFVVKNQMQKWIFNKYQLYEDMYDDLTRDIWMQIFGIGQQIFEPLEKLDVRFKLQDQYQYDAGFNQSMRRNVRKVMDSIEGQVNLVHHHKNISPFKHSLLHREKKSEQMNEILNWWNSNSRLSVYLDLQNIKSLFIPNLNIKEIIAIEKNARERSIKDNPTIVDL